MALTEKLNIFLKILLKISKDAQIIPLTNTL